MLGWFRRFCPPPPPLGCCLCPGGLRFSFLLPFQGLPVPGQVCWCFLLPLFFCVPLLVSLLSTFHLICIFISFPYPVILTFTSLSGPQLSPLRWGVCVKHLNRCKTSFHLQGLLLRLFFHVSVCCSISISILSDSPLICMLFASPIAIDLQMIQQGNFVGFNALLHGLLFHRF